MAADLQPTQTPPQASAQGWELLRSSRLWPAATIALGVSLWAQLFLIGIWAEGQFDVVRTHALLAYFIPLSLLFVGVKLRMAMVLLTFFPVLLLPGLVMLPAPERLMLAEGLSMVRLSASLALYLAVASAGADVVRQPEEAEALDPQSLNASTLDYKRFILARIGVLIVLFLVPAYAIFQDPEVGAALATHYSEKPEVAQTFLGLMHFFAWSVAAYMMVLMPALNLEYDQRRLNRQLKSTLQELSARTIGKRVILWLCLGGLAFGLLAMLSS